MATIDLRQFADNLESILTRQIVPASLSPQIKEKIKAYIVTDENNKIVEISVSQSMISRFYFKGEVRDYCPMKEYHVTVLKDAKIKQTPAMEAGSYLETLCIGSTASGEKATMALTNRGKKSVNQERIEEQAMNFKLICEEHGIIINKVDEPGRPKNVQKSFSVPVEIDGFEDIRVIINLTTDILSPITYGQVDYPMAVIDLKLTWDRNSTFGEYCWGAPEYMDHTQAFLYGFILGMPFFYLVLDYNSKDRGYKIVPVNTNLQHPDQGKREEAMRRYKETIELIKATITRIINHHYHGWYTNPSHDNCKSCPLECADRNKNQEV